MRYDCHEQCEPEMKGRDHSRQMRTRGFDTGATSFSLTSTSKSKNGQLRPRQELLTRLEQLKSSGDLKDEAAHALLGISSRTCEHHRRCMGGEPTTSGGAPVERTCGAFFRGRARNPRQ